MWSVPSNLELKQTSGFSPLTWITGKSTNLARSEQYLEHLPLSAGVVKPTWLFTIKCIVPPISKCGTLDNDKDSWFIPWALNAASPCTF